MSRWIDADALKKEIKQDIADDGLTERYVFYRINEAPSIDIVRCKECRFSVNVITSWSANGENKRVERLCKVNSHNVNDNDFCSYGERSSK